MLDEQKIPGRPAFFYPGPPSSPVFPAAGSGPFAVAALQPVAVDRKLARNGHMPRRAGRTTAVACRHDGLAGCVAIGAVTQAFPARTACAAAENMPASRAALAGEAIRYLVVFSFRILARRPPASSAPWIRQPVRGKEASSMAWKNVSAVLLVLLLGVSGLAAATSDTELSAVVASIKQVGDKGGGPSRRAGGLAKAGRCRRFAIARHPGRSGRRQPAGGQLAAGCGRGDRCPAACRRRLAADRRAGGISGRPAACSAQPTVGLRMAGASRPGGGRSVAAAECSTTRAWSCGATRWRNCSSKPRRRSRAIRARQRRFCNDALDHARDLDQIRAAIGKLERPGREDRSRPAAWLHHALESHRAV